MAFWRSINRYTERPTLGLQQWFFLFKVSTWSK
jgi:hypothetical protein